VTERSARSIVPSLALALVAVIIAGALALAVPALAWAFPGNVAFAVGAALVAAGATLIVALFRTRALERTLQRAQWSERELRASEAKFSGILDIADDAIITVDEAQAIVHYNKGAEKMFGYTADEMHGRPLDTLIPARFRRTHDAHVHAFGQGPETARRMGERREIFGVRHGGEEFPAEASISRLETPSGRLYTVVMRDVTFRKRAEEAQRVLATVSERLAQSIELEATAEAIVNAAVPELADACLLDVTEPDGVIRRRASTTAGDGARALAAIVGGGTLSPDSPSRAIDVLRSARSELVSPVTHEWMEAHTHAPEAWRQLGVTSLMMVPLVIHGRTTGVLSFLGMGAGRRPYTPEDLPMAEEIGHRVALALDNARLYESARSATRARDEVLGVVSHDLRNPLSAIAMLARGLREPDTDPDARTEMADSITQATRWMQRLIQDLLDVSAIEARRLSVERTPVDVAPIVATAVSLVGPDARERGLAMSVSLPDALPLIDADAERIVQVLTNLLGNAVKFTTAGGSIAVSARPGQGTVVLSVSDTGSGIPADELPNVFTRYWHARRKSDRRGSGLGLAIAHGIVDAHGGRIWAESAVGRGTTVSFALPAADDGAGR
jgi:PAS domain S-box-containing protein